MIWWLDQEELRPKPWVSFYIISLGWWTASLKVWAGGRAPVGQEPYLVLAAVETDHEIVNHQIVLGRFVAEAQLFETRPELFHLRNDDRLL